MELTYYDRKIRTLAEARKEAKLSQVKLAEKCGLSQFTITQIETGKASPKPTTCKQIEKYVGRVNWLCTNGFNYKTKIIPNENWEVIEKELRKILLKSLQLNNKEFYDFLDRIKDYLIVVEIFEKELLFRKNK